MYISFNEYKDMGGNLDSEEFARCEYEAERAIDRATTGIDGVHKLQIAFPTKEYDKTAVQHCLVELINAVGIIKKYETNAGTADGPMASVSSGSESISFVTGTSAIKAICSPQDKQAYLYNICLDYLKGITDANGVNLLYGGEYV